MKVSIDLDNEPLGSFDIVPSDHFSKLQILLQGDNASLCRMLCLLTSSAGMHVLPSSLYTHPQEGRFGVREDVTSSDFQM